MPACRRSRPAAPRPTARRRHVRRRLARRPVVGLVGGVAAPAVEGVVEAACRLRAGRGRRHTCARGRARRRAGRPPRARDRAAPYRRRARWSPAGAAARSARPNSSTIESKVHRSPRWLQNTPSMSNGVAPKRSATACTSDGATNRKTAAGSTKRRISHGQAMRSIFGRERVTQTVRPRRGAAACSAPSAGRPRPGCDAALEGIGRHALVAKPGRRPLAELQPVAGRSRSRSGRRTPEPTRTACRRPPHRAGNQPGIGGEILIEADIDQGRTLRRADRRASLSGEMALIDDMVRPRLEAGRDASACRLMGEPRAAGPPARRRPTGCSRRPAPPPPSPSAAGGNRRTSSRPRAAG